jgi:hypothetical protein
MNWIKVSRDNPSPGKDTVPKIGRRAESLSNSDPTSKFQPVLEFTNKMEQLNLEEKETLAKKPVGPIECELIVELIEGTNLQPADINGNS